MRFHSLLPAFYPNDATGSIACELQQLLRRLGFQSELFALDIHPELKDLAHPATELARSVEPSDAVLYHHGIGSELVPLLSSLPARKVLAYHNITPSRFFKPFDPAVARALDDGRLQLAALAEMCEGALAFSKFSGADLKALRFRRVSIIPPPLEPWRVCRAGDERIFRRLFDGKTQNLLFVGRVVPNKRIEDLIALTERLLRRNPGRAFRLVVAGPYQRASAYFERLGELAEPIAEQVVFLGAVSQHELCAAYRAAHLFVSMSEHEGFGLPICEAMAAGVPVIAYDGGAVSEAMGDAGLLFRPKRIERVAALCEILLDDPVRRRRLIEGGRIRAAQLSPEATLGPLASALEPLRRAGARRATRARAKPKVAFVVQRYGPEVVGGAERHCRLLAQRMAACWDVEVVTTCAADYLTWENAYPAGRSLDGAVTVRRFATTRTRDMRRFNALSRRLFGRAQDSLSEQRWLGEQGPHSPALIEFLLSEQADHDGFVFFTYLYEPTALGLPVIGRRALFVPTAHDEPPLRFGIYRQTFSAPAGILFNTPEEQALCEGLFEMAGVHKEVVGVGVEAEPGDAHPLLDKVGLRGDYLLYLGRIAPGKGIPELLDGYGRLRQRLGALAPALVLAGANEMRLKNQAGVYLPGGLTESAKWGALRGAAAVVVPSAQESLSLAALEAWSTGRPVIANGESPVLNGQARRSGAAVTYRGPAQFAETTGALLEDTARVSRLGDAGRRFVEEHYSWARITGRYEQLLNELVLRPAGARTPSGERAALRAVRREAL
jgi:glycosyltransferase involved in cell wall biosynthesis